MNIFDKMKDKIIEKKKVIALGLAGTLLAGVAGTYGFHTAKKMRDNYFELDNNISFEDALEDISSSSKIDDIILSDNINKFNTYNNQLSLSESLNIYKDARINENMDKLNNSLERLGLLVLKSSVADALNLKLDSIRELKIIEPNNVFAVPSVFVKFDREVSNLVAGNIIDKDIIEEAKTYILKGEANDIVSIISDAQTNSYKTEVAVDNAYTKIIKFLYAKGNIKERIILNDNIEFSYDQKLIKKYKK